MKFNRRISITSELEQIEITPLIDCVFLLLIFFMLTSNFVVTSGITIKLPRASIHQAVDTKTITVTVSSEDIIYVRGKVFTYSELENYLKSLKLKSIFIKADRDSSIGAIVGIWNVCKRLGIDKIGIATISENANGQR